MLGGPWFLVSGGGAHARSKIECYDIVDCFINILLVVGAIDGWVVVGEGEGAEQHLAVGERLFERIVVGENDNMGVAVRGKLE